MGRPVPRGTNNSVESFNIAYYIKTVILTEVAGRLIVYLLFPLCVLTFKLEFLRARGYDWEGNRGITLAKRQRLKRFTHLRAQ